MATGFAILPAKIKKQSSPDVFVEAGKLAAGFPVTAQWRWLATLAVITDNARHIGRGSRPGQERIAGHAVPPVHFLKGTSLRPTMPDENT